MVLLAAGCDVARPTFECGTSWEKCGPGGACEPETQSCSFADDSCAVTGRRFSSISPEPFRDQCVEYRDQAPAGAMCDPDDPTCAEGRACLGGRCVSTEDLDTGKLLTCARCAVRPNPFGVLLCFGESAALSPFPPTVMHWPGHACPAFCPAECAMCATNPAQCPASCVGSDVTTDYSVGENHFCFNSGQLYCVGKHDQGQLGKGEPDLPPGPDLATVRVDPTFNYPFVASGAKHNCGRGAITDRVFCWGSNDAGQLDITGAFTQPNSTTPIGNAPFTTSGGVLLGVEYIALSARFSCATSDEDVNCWGDVPWGAGVVPDLPAGQITDFDVGAGHACAIKDRRVVCWGNNRQGQVDPSAPSMLAPPTILLDTEATRVVTGRAHSCAIDAAGAVWCWGESAAGQLDGAAGPGPVRVRADPPAVGPISAGDDVTCAVFADDRVRCWGNVLQTGGTAYRDFEICER